MKAGWCAGWRQQAGGGRCDWRMRLWLAVFMGLAFGARGDPYVLAYTTTNLVGHGLSAEDNPGGGVTGVVFTCSTADVAVTHFPGYSVVTANPRKTNVWVNAIAGKAFVETLPDGQRIVPGRYRYAGEFRIPVLSTTDLNQPTNGQNNVVVMFFWDGREAYFDSGRASLEAGLSWTVNAWDTNNLGRIHVYTYPVVPVDTGLRVMPDTNWHSFMIEADFRTKRFGAVEVDGNTADMSHVELAEVLRTNWGNEVALMLTQESLSAWPGHFCAYAYTWDTHYRNVSLSYRPPEEPVWWWTRRVLEVPLVTQDYAAVNQGQVKWLAWQAYATLTNTYGPGDDIAEDPWPSASNLVHSYRNTNNHAAVNLGQLKYAARPFWCWLMRRGGTTNYPWSLTTDDDCDTVPANVGQAKQAFGFAVP